MSGAQKLRRFALRVSAPPHIRLLTQWIRQKHHFSLKFHWAGHNASLRRHIFTTALCLWNKSFQRRQVGLVPRPCSLGLRSGRLGSGTVWRHGQEALTIFAFDCTSENHEIFTVDRSWRGRPSWQNKQVAHTLLICQRSFCNLYRLWSLFPYPLG